MQQSEQIEIKNYKNIGPKNQFLLDNLQKNTNNHISPNLTQ